MIDFKEELKKLKPCLEVQDVETAVYTRDLSDVIDLINENERKERERRYSDTSQNEADGYLDE